MVRSRPDDKITRCRGFAETGRLLLHRAVGEAERTESWSASWVTQCQLGTTNRSRGPHSKVCSPIRVRPLPSIAANTVASVER